MELNEKDFELLDEKLNNPDKIVKCPRCNAEIIIKKLDCGCIVRCKNGCIEDKVRGI